MHSNYRTGKRHVGRERLNSVVQGSGTILGIDHKSGRNPLKHPDLVIGRSIEVFPDRKHDRFTNHVFISSVF